MRQKINSPVLNVDLVGRGAGGGRDISPERYISKARLGGKREWERGVEDKIKISLPFLQCPKA